VLHPSIPLDLRALPAELFTQPLFSVHFSTFYASVNLAEIEKKYNKKQGVGRETKARQEWVQRAALKKLDPDEKISQKCKTVSST
jgi:hypothetical protein